MRGVGLFAEFLETMGMDVDRNQLYGTLYRKAMEGEADGGGLLSYGYLSGEHITGFEEGRPMFVRTPDSRFNLANFMRVNLYTALGALKTGMDILKREEGVQSDRIMGHGGLFKTKGAGQQIMADAMEIPVAVMETAGEGRCMGNSLLAAFNAEKNGRTLDQYLAEAVFQDSRDFRFESRRGRCRRLPKLYGALYERAFDRTRSSGKHVNEEHNQVPGIVKEE